MAWTDEQCADLYGKYWDKGEAECPNTNCGGLVRFTLNTFPGGFVLTGKCSKGDGTLQISNSQDPLASTFRPWTDAEADAIVDDHFKGRSSRCPVDHATVDVQEFPHLTGDNLVISKCPRCFQGARREVKKQ